MKTLSRFKTNRRWWFLSQYDLTVYGGF